MNCARIPFAAALKAGVSACLVALVLFLVFLSSSHGAHAALHADAHCEEHQCAVTLFAAGQVLVPEAAGAEAALVTALFLLPPQRAEISAPAGDRQLAHGRAPPRA